MKIKSKFMKLLTITITVSSLLVGCGDKESAKDTSTNNEEKVQKLLIGTSGSPKPFSYLNDKNELDGYDVAVLKEIDNLLPQYEIKFEKTEFKSIFAGVDSGRYQVGANNITKKPEREEKYLFNNIHHLYNQTVIAVKKGRTDIKSLEDLEGKKVPIKANGGFEQLFIEQYNEKNPNNKIDIAYTDQDLSKTYQDIDLGTYDFTFIEKAMIKPLEEAYGFNLDYIELSKEDAEKIQNPYGYFIFSKTGDGPRIRDDFDKAIKTLIENGKLNELSNEYLGGDYTK